MNQDNAGRALEYIRLRGLGWSNERIADQFNIQPASVRRTINLYKQFNPDLSTNDSASKNLIGGPDFEQGGTSLPDLNNDANSGGEVPQIDGKPGQLSFDDIHISESIADVEQPLQVPTNDCMVFGDLHVPMHNTLMLRRAIHIRNTCFAHIRHLLVGGDWHNFDRISRHPKNAPGVATEFELQKSSEVGHDIGSWFDWIGVIPGNHDERFAARLDDDISLKRLFGLVFTDHWPDAEFHFSNLDYAFIGDKWVAGHPSSYSGQGGKKPAELTDFYQRNAISFHNHIVGEAQNKNGNFIGVDAGHMTDPNKHFIPSGVSTILRAGAQVS
jgi:hypothetical protein